MDPKSQSKLLDINQVFYNRFASSFSATRQQVQPGVRELIQRIQPDASVLDIGCGNGTLARALAFQGFTGKYLGVDMSASLLEQAETLLDDPSSDRYEFQLADLASPTWHIPFPKMAYDWLTAFAVLHHLPGENLRQQTVDTFSKLIPPYGFCVVSVWQWQNSPRLQRRVLPWSTVDLNPENLDQGDVLLDWRADQVPGLRYVHTFTKASLRDLAEGAGLRVMESYFSDGKSGNLALYQVWQKS